MKWIVLFFAMIGSVAGYIRFERPEVWDQALRSLMTAPPFDTQNSNEPLPLAQNTPSSLPAQPVQAEIISPDSAYVNSAHVHEVEQPPQPNAPTGPIFPREYVPPSPLPSQANWIWTVNGKDYHNVTILKTEADAVSVSYDGGIGSFDLSDLSPDIQKMLNYDPQFAVVAAKKKAKAVADSEAELLAEKVQNQSAASPAPSLTPSAYVTSLSVNPPRTPVVSHTNLSLDQQSAIQAKIASLQADITYMQREEAKVSDNRLRTDGRVVSNGAYAEKIGEEQSEIAQLQSQLLR